MMAKLSTKRRAELGIALAKRVIEYITDEPIEAALECDAEVRAMARAVLDGIEFVPAKTAGRDHRDAERSLAYEMASGLIESDGFAERDGEDRWLDIGGEVEAVDAACYLETRGLLERHPEHSDWVRVLDESGATHE